MTFVEDNLAVPVKESEPPFLEPFLELCPTGSVTTGRALELVRNGNHHMPIHTRLFKYVMLYPVKHYVATKNHTEQLNDTRE